MSISVAFRKILSKTPKIIQTIGNTSIKNAPTILTVGGIFGVISTATFAAKAGAAADSKIRNIKGDRQNAYEKGTVETPDVSKRDIFKAVAPIYAPTVISGAVTIAFIVGVRSIDAKRQAAMAALYTASEAALREYQQKVSDKIGEKEAQDIISALNKDKLDESVRKYDPKFIPVPGHGEFLCLDTLSGRFFRSSREEICRAVNEVNRMIFGEMWVTLNEFYMELGLDSVGLGESIGWNVDRLLEVDITSQIEDSTGEPFLVINYPIGPVRYNSR